MIVLVCVFVYGCVCVSACVDVCMRGLGVRDCAGSCFYDVFVFL